MLFLVVDERVSREGEYMKEGIGSGVVPSYRELVEQLDSAKKLKDELGKKITKLTRPPFLTVETRYKVNMAEYKKWLVDHDDTFYKNAMSTKLGDSSIKKINIETFRKSQEETNEC